MSSNRNERRGSESSEEQGAPQDHFGEHIYARLLNSKKMLTAAQMDLLITTLRQEHPHHGRLLFVMRQVGLWLPVTLGLQIGDFARDQPIVHIARGWADQGMYPIPKKVGRGYFQQGDLCPTIRPVSPSVLDTVHEQISFLDVGGYPTGAHDWLFPGKTSGHPWNPGIFSQMVLQPALRQLQLPPVTPKELYFSIMRLRVEELVKALPEPSTIHPGSPCPTCGQDASQRLPGGTTPLCLDPIPHPSHYQRSTP